MKAEYSYGTVTEAINAFRNEGFTIDFNLEENCISCAEGKFGVDEFRIVKIFRYEGLTDPADEAAVYAIESSTGKKGVLVTGYGPSSDAYSTEVLEKLQLRK